LPGERCCYEGCGAAAALRDSGALALRKRQNTSWGDVAVLANEAKTHAERSSGFFGRAPSSPLVVAATT
jgi:hypothetical protein